MRGYNSLQGNSNPFYQGSQSMNYRRMGNTGLKLSELSLGTWITFGDQIDEKAASELVHAAYDRGVNFFDNADVYANGQAEVVMGKVMRDLPRESLVLSSKVYWPSMEGVNGRGLSRKHIMESCHASLKRMGTDYLDLYFCHRYDDETPLQETVRAMDDLVHQGKVLYWGTSEWRAYQIERARTIASEWGLFPPSVEQPQYNMFVRSLVEGEIVPAADEIGYGIVTWSPLRYGLLSGKYNEGMPEGTRLSRDPEWADRVVTEDRVEKVRRLSEIAKELGVSMSQLAIGWLLRLPQVTSVITGASRLAHLEDNLGSADVVEKLTPEILERIDNALGKAD
jgi:voltage-dependent potassium channel beta subunit